MKKHFLKSLFLLALMPLSALFAQDEQMSKRHNLKLAFEFGYNMPGCRLAELERMRMNYNSGSPYDAEEKFSLRTTYVGVKPEFFIINNRIGIASGVRFTATSTKYDSRKNDFFWKLQEDGLNTNYVRINDISQKAYLLSVPLEVRYFLNNRELAFQTYFKIGVSLNLPIYFENPHVNFTDKAMEKYESLVQSQLPKNSYRVIGFGFGAVGFKIGKFTEGRRVPWMNIEFQFPYLLQTYFMGTDEPYTFVMGGIDIGVGIQCSFEIPMRKNVPIGSR